MCTLLTMIGVRGDDTSPPQTRVESIDDQPIILLADFSHEWHDGDSEIAMFRGNCKLKQGKSSVQAQKMVIWTHKQDKITTITAYFEGDVKYENTEKTLSENILLLEWKTASGMQAAIRRRVTLDEPPIDPLFKRAEQRREIAQNRTHLPAQYVVPPRPDDIFDQPYETPIEADRENVRRVRIFPRSAVPYNVYTYRSDKTTPPEQIWLLTGGVTIMIDGVHENGTLDLSADNIVIWTSASENKELQTDTLQTKDMPFQIYLEGNIIHRQGFEKIFASQAYFDARDKRGLMLDAEIRTYIPSIDATLRVWSKRVRQLSEKSYHAEEAWFSTSQFGRPGYRLQASDVFLDQHYTTPWLTTFDNNSGEAEGERQYKEVPWITSRNNKFYLNDVPVGYVPYLSTPTEDPGIPLNGAVVTQDRIFGTQVRTSWDMFKLFGREPAENVTWDALFDYYSDRGPGVGTKGDYIFEDLFGMPGLSSGLGTLYYVHDTGSDNLGLDRRSINPETNDRWRTLLRHHQDLPDDWDLFGEVGVLSDRNFLEQYFENDFDEDKDQETLLYARKRFENWGGTLFARPNIDGIETTTEWYPKADLYGLGEPLFDGLLNWSSHSSAGYAHLRPADLPTQPADIFTPLPYVADVQGGVYMTRQELSLPLHLGAFNIAPYVMGEASHWDSDFTSNSLDRLYGSAGVRGSVMMWKPYPHVQSNMFNLNGLVHKMVFDADFSASDSNTNLADIPQYTDLDDNAQERFRSRFITNTFGGVLPAIFEPRNYAVREGAAHNVSTPVYELVDDQQVLRMGWRHRLQTKVGPPDRLRVKDWMTLDLEASFFPDEDRDNFGESFGLLTSRYTWNVGDRTKILANSLHDLFLNGQDVWNLGILSQRSTRGSVYVGMRNISGGPLNSQILTASYSYRMSEKWVSSVGTAYDLGENLNRGQSLTLTRIGADFLVHIGASYDQSKDNVGVGISVEPRFGPFQGNSSQLSSLLGTQ
ncbi:MAG: hypothetical protein O3A29_15610 [Planctomycetota bacterium]|nr:hypothetical protein [Planctomycetota bacterium]